MGSARPSAPSELSGPLRVSLPADIRAALVTHTIAGLPNEACGIILGDRAPEAGGVPVRFVPARNAAASPLRYEIDPSELLSILLAADEDDLTVWGIFHSHLHGDARPSATDIASAHYPDAVHLIVSLAPETAGNPDAGDPTIRIWRIGESVSEVELRFR